MYLFFYVTIGINDVGGALSIRVPLITSDSQLSTAWFLATSFMQPQQESTCYKLKHGGQPNPAFVTTLLRLRIWHNSPLNQKRGQWLMAFKHISLPRVL